MTTSDMEIVQEANQGGSIMVNTKHDMGQGMGINVVTTQKEQELVTTHAEHVRALRGKEIVLSGPSTVARIQGPQINYFLHPLSLLPP